MARRQPGGLSLPPRLLAPEITPPSPDELARLQASVAADDPELAMFIRLSAMTGARRSEMLALRWTDVDLGRGAVAISRGIVMGLDGLVEKGTKTHQARRVALDASTAAALAVFQTTHRARAELCGTVLAADAFVFAADIEGRTSWYPDSASRRFRGACRKVGLDGVRLHDLRHYVATRLLTAGVDVRTVAGRLGHRNAATTLNVYSHFLPTVSGGSPQQRWGSLVQSGSGLIVGLSGWVPVRPVRRARDSVRSHRESCRLRGVRRRYARRSLGRVRGHQLPGRRGWVAQRARPIR